MDFFANLFGWRADPTETWSHFRPPIPEVDLGNLQFDSLRWGDPLRRAEFLGKPDQFIWKRDYCELIYAQGGFEIDFDHDRWEYLAFFIGPDEYMPEHEALAFSSPVIRGGGLDGVVLNREVDRAQIEAWFGKTPEKDVDDDETILYYFDNPAITFEFELDGPTGKLKRWNLYPPDNE